MYTSVNWRIRCVRTAKEGGIPSQEIYQWFKEKIAKQINLSQRFVSEISFFFFNAMKPAKYDMNELASVKHVSIWANIFSLVMNK